MNIKKIFIVRSEGCLTFRPWGLSLTVIKQTIYDLVMKFIKIALAAKV